jgi:superfamily I DNA/RNA helicase
MNSINIEKDIYIRRVIACKFAVCAIPDKEVLSKIEEHDKIYLITKYKQKLLLRNKRQFKIEIDNNKIIKAWFCKIIEPFEEELSDKEEIKTIPIIYGRCKRSMLKLDRIYRKYVSKYKFKKNEIMAIKSVAGSGKTTTLLDLAKRHKKKKILYLAFNKSLIGEIKTKINKQKIYNLYPSTFDALMRNIYIEHYQKEPRIVILTAHTISQEIEYFEGKYYTVRNYYSKWFNKFCNQTEYNDINKYAINKIGVKKPLLDKVWDCIKQDRFQTFDSIRKKVHMNHLSKNYIDKKYDMIFIDEAQDFDNIMLQILLNDTTIPKIFVGDQKQSIYQWRGCINAFERLPKTSNIIEFYSTFRIGEPACSKIRDQFNNCWMISGNKKKTTLEYNKTIEGNYVYLFRSWRYLLQTAQTISNVWINNYKRQIEYIKRLHKKLQISDLSEDEKSEFSDDLPAFLIKMTYDELDELINNIENNIVEKDKSECQMYTIHSYKGMENDIVRIYNDIDISKEDNLYYVALTRGCKRIIVDFEETEIEIYNTKQKLIQNKTKPKIKLTEKMDRDTIDKLIISFSNEKILLSEKLTEYRKDMSKILEKPAYCIFSNKVLDSLTKELPRSNTDLIKIKGIGRSFIQKFGDDVLEIIAGY